MMTEAARALVEHVLADCQATGADDATASIAALYVLAKMVITARRSMTHGFVRPLKEEEAKS